MALGPGVEWNMNADRNFATGAALGADYNLFNAFAAGLSVGFSANFTAFTAIESAAMFRWYVFGDNRAGLFAQADAGLFLYMEDVETKPMFLGGLRAGYRLPLGAMFYVEPYARGGYPFVFSVGVNAGMFLLSGRDKTVVITATGDRPARMPERTERVSDRGSIFDEIQADEATASTEPSYDPVAGRYYIVRRGDTLWHVAIWVYGDAFKWRLIADANGHIASPDLIIPGQRLFIPLDETKKE